MAELETLKSLFKDSIFRIPDYQRGFAWKVEQLEDFWFDLINLENDRSHYTGVITLKKIKSSSQPKNANERWLIDNGYKMYHIIDGQQRLTTSIILIQAIIEIVKEYYKNKDSDEIIFCDQKLTDIIKNFLSEKSLKHNLITYKFGYIEDNPSYEYFRHNILNEPYSGTIQETFYTLNLQNAKNYFKKQLNSLIGNKSIESIETEYKKLITRFLFNPYEIPSDFDEFLAFETMNNRGKKLSNLELLKNRLIYLVTLYNDKELSVAGKKELRDSINGTWKEVYMQLGKNKTHPLNDDEFLRAHWIMFFIYSRKRGDDYVKYLLNNRFSLNSVLKKKPVKVNLEKIEEVSEEEIEKDELEREENSNLVLKAELSPNELKKYVGSMKESAKHWYNSWFPLQNTDIDPEIALWLDKLNRLPIFYFRPMVMSLLLNKKLSTEEKVIILKKIERYLFITFRLNKTQSTNGSSEFYNAARRLYNNELNYESLIELLDINTNYFFDKNGFKFNGFKQLIADRFNGKRKDGFYGWPAIYYFLYEYELFKMKTRGTPKIDWRLFIKSEKDKYSIEHIYPQESSKKYWQKRFNKFTDEKKNILANSLGNLIPLSMSINSSLQNDGFDDKKKTIRNAKNEIIRNGYENGSYSEIEISRETEWTADIILNRGLILLKFLETRWDVNLGTKKDKIELLNLQFLIKK
ncbi:MAG: DUF262 domain-containing HNH endonuclease family protein [Ignavibacteria bacterium]|nr:DUF262 domain-containing HNH endonuclease family protein [Ignavibacteria bacterium]